MCSCFCRLLLEAVLQQSHAVAADAKGSGNGVQTPIRCFAADAFGTGAA